MFINLGCLNVYMKKIFKIILVPLISLFSIFIIEECLRLKMVEGSKPLWIIDRTKYCITCIEPGEYLDEEYWSFGYKVKVRYYSSKESTDDNKMIKITYKEFLLFNKLTIWKWSK